MVKSEGEQRKSDGVVVPLMAGRDPVGGKGPDFDHARGAGKHKGMAGAARSNYPDRTPPVDNVRKLQRKLWAAAKQSPERRFHALFDRVHRGDTLVEAWKRVRADKGAAGVDRQTLEHPALRSPGFLGCHFRARMSGRLWEQKRIVRYYLHRWPSQKAMKRLREKITHRTSRSRVGIDVRDVIAELNPILRGWGNYFATGNAAVKFTEVDRYVVWRLKRLQIKKRGRNLRAGQATQWTPSWFHDQGLHQLMGTVRYPKAA
jgi:Group II intron, maturase-specific domain